MIPEEIRNSVIWCEAFQRRISDSPKRFCRANSSRRLRVAFVILHVWLVRAFGLSVKLTHA